MESVSKLPLILTDDLERDLTISGSRKFKYL